MGAASELPAERVKKLSNEVSRFSTPLPPLHFSLLLLFSLSYSSPYLFFRLSLLKACSPGALGGCFAEQRSRAGFGDDEGSLIGCSRL